MASSLLCTVWRKPCTDHTEIKQKPSKSSAYSCLGTQWKSTGSKFTISDAYCLLYYYQSPSTLKLVLPTYQYDHIHPTLHQQVQPVLVIIVGANGGAAQQLFSRVFGGQREVSVLLQVCAGDD